MNFIPSRLHHVWSSAPFRQRERLCACHEVLSGYQLLLVLKEKQICFCIFATIYFPFREKAHEIHSNIESFYRTAGDQRIFFRHHLKAAARVIPSPLPILAPSCIEIKVLVSMLSRNLFSLFAKKLTKCHEILKFSQNSLFAAHLLCSLLRGCI